MAKQESVGFMEFIEKYSTEEDCREHLFEIRWPNGFICPKCGNSGYYNLTTRDLFECTSCHYQASVTSGTIMIKEYLNRLGLNSPKLVYDKSS